MSCRCRTRLAALVALSLVATGCSSEETEPAEAALPPAPAAEQAFAPSLSPIRAGNMMRQQVDVQNQATRDRRQLIDQAVQGNR